MTSTIESSSNVIEIDLCDESSHGLAVVGSRSMMLLLPAASSLLSELNASDCSD